MTFLLYTLLTLFIIVCIFLMLLVLIQKGRGGGLASAFGGAGGNTAFGSKTGDVLTWATSIVFGVFLLLAIALNLIANRNQPKFDKDDVGANAPLSQTPPLTPSPQPPASPAPVQP